ncbi:MAG: FHA domain-containing protein [Dorea sp.]|nr:FHA domain-containing protein [Dorea sp.]
MEINSFTYEEQGEKRYLVYEKKTEDHMDTLTLEMMSNNKIDGVSSGNHIQIDDKFYMKYDISGLMNLREYLQGVVSRQKILSILESIADAAIASEDYMLSISSYVMDMEYVYIEPDTLKVSMVVLPVVREGRKIDVFLKEMFMGIRYDQTEDCSYVASLLNLLGGAGTFSIHTFKEEINRLKKENNSKPQPQGQILDSQLCMQAFEKPPQPYRHIPQSYQQNVQQNTPAGRNGGGLSEEDRKLIVRDLKREKNLDILFSEEEEVKKEKKGFFFMKDKSEKEKKPEKEKKEDKKKEKKSLWGKLTGKKRSSEKNSPAESPLGRIDIPGMEAAIPFQNVEINKRRVDMQDFGETVFLDGDDDEETYIIGAKQNTVQPEFILYRHGTGESYRICEEVTRIGRSTSIAEICITGNRGIGRVHALLYLRNGEVFIEDNNSKNHTYVDGMKLEPGQSPVKLVHGSKIRLGDEELEFAVQ